MKKLLLLLALLCLPIASDAQGGATFTFSMSVSGPASTSMTLTATSPCTLSGSQFTCTGALAAGQQIASIAIGPAGWTGGITIGSFTGSATASSMQISGSTPNYTLNAGASGLLVGFSGGATLTATP